MWDRIHIREELVEAYSQEEEVHKDNKMGMEVVDTISSFHFRSCYSFKGVDCIINFTNELNL